MRNRFLLAAAALAVALPLVPTDGAARACDAAEEFAARKAAIAGVDATDRITALYRLGDWARENGLPRRASEQFRAVLELDADHSAARNALGYERLGEKWLTQDEAMRSKGLVRRDGRWMLAEEARILDLPARERAARKEQQAKVKRLLEQFAVAPPRARKNARAALDGVDDAYKVEPFAYALRSPHESVRELAAQELGRIQDRRAIRPLLHRAIFDPSEPVRHAALDAAKGIGDPNLLLPLVRVMEGDDARHRVNAADAIGRLGDVRGVTYLVYKYEARGGGAPQSVFSSIRQLSFIQDFDVEVASTAFIADPIVGVIQDGIVLETKIVASSHVGHMVEREAIHGALRRLTGATDVPNESGAWAKWMRENDRADEQARAE